MPNYSFKYSGEIAPKADKLQVQSNLAKLFAISPKEAQKIMDGSHIFIRENLEKQTAEAYRTTFKRCGALGEIHADNPDIRQTMQFFVISTVCPKCQSENVVEDICQDCRTSISEFQESLERQSNTQDPLRELEIFEQSAAKRQRAKIWLWASSIIIIVLFFIDALLHNTPIVNVGGVDIGYFPFVLAHIALINSCVLFARSKGYMGVWGILGLLSFAGLSILLLLPDKGNSKKTKQSNLHGWRAVVHSHYLKNGGAAFVCLVLMLAWPIKHLNLSNQAGEYIIKANLLHIGRSEYPSKALDSDTRRYLKEAAELKSFVAETLPFISKTDLRGEQKSKLVETLFSEIARYEIWLNYQKYLHAVNDTPSPAPLSPRNIAKTQQDIANIIRRHLNVQDTKNPVNRLVGHWLLGNFGNSGDASRIWININKTIQDIVEAALSGDSSIAHASDKKSSKLNTKHLHVRKVEDLLRINFNMEEFRSDSLVIAIYRQKTLRQEGVIEYPYVAACISYRFPQKYLFSQINVLQPYKKLLFGF